MLELVSAKKLVDVGMSACWVRIPRIVDSNIAAARKMYFCDLSSDYSSVNFVI